MKSFLLLLSLLGMLTGFAPAAANADTVHVLGDGPPRLNVGLGYFNFANGGGSTPAAARIEWRFGKKVLWRLGPVLGALANTDEGYLVYGGVHLDIAWHRLVLTPMTSIGAWHEGESKDLGGVLQFRSALELAWTAGRDLRLGLQVGHISNANLHHTNAGENDIFLTLGIPF